MGFTPTSLEWLFCRDARRRDALLTVLFDNNIRPILMWSRVGGAGGAPRYGRRDLVSGVISEANSSNNWEEELREMDGRPVNPFREGGEFVYIR